MKSHVYKKFKNLIFLNTYLAYKVNIFRLLQKCKDFNYFIYKFILFYLNKRCAHFFLLFMNLSYK